MVRKVVANQAARRADRLAAARAIVAERGLDGLTAAALAEATGTVPAALYRTFPSMDALKGELVAGALDRLADDLRRTRGPNRVVAVAGMLSSLRRRRPEDHELIDAALSPLAPVFSDDVARRVEEHLQRVLDVAVEALDDAVRAGVIRPGDSSLRVRVLLAFAHGVDHLVKRDRLEPAGRRAARVLEEGVEALIAGWT